MEWAGAKFSRRWFLGGVALTGAGAVSAALYHRWRQGQPPDEEPEPEVAAPTLDQALLAERLIGRWDFRLQTDAGVFPELPAGSQLLLDVGPGGRALRGLLGPPPFTGAGLQLYGELDTTRWPHLRWKFVDAQGAAFECGAIFDEIWDGWSTGGGGATLSGQLRRTGAQPGHTAPQIGFVALRHPAVEARERLPYVAALQAWLVSPGHRLFHQLWHASRDLWHKLDNDKRDDLRALGWQPGTLGDERAARGKQRHENGSGEDFLFMHRRMLRHARSFQPLPSWRSLPSPRPPLDHDARAFADYLANADGFSVPPAWESRGDTAFNRWLLNIKSSEGFYSNFQLWEAQYQNPDYLSTLCLGELGSRIELGLHDWLHMRWASVCRDPNSGRPLLYNRNPIDFAERWFGPDNDFLGDPFSSHLNPVFWSFHGWIDDRIEDWFLAHEQAHPGQVRRQLIDGVPWFAPGPWVRVKEPWLGPASAGCGAWMRGNGGGSGDYDIETMKLALRIAFGEEEEVTRLRPRVPRRPWFARHLAPGA